MCRLLDSTPLLAAGIVFVIYKVADATTDLIDLLLWLSRKGRLMKTIIQEGTTKYNTRCDECGCRFTYDREDVHENYVRGGDWVSCPSCGTSCRHCGAPLSRRERNAWSNSRVD